MLFWACMQNYHMQISLLNRNHYLVVVHNILRLIWMEHFVVIEKNDTLDLLQTQSVISVLSWKRNTFLYKLDFGAIYFLVIFFGYIGFNISIHGSLATYVRTFSKKKSNVRTYYLLRHETGIFNTWWRIM